MTKVRGEPTGGRFPLLALPPRAATRADLSVASGRWTIAYQLPMGKVSEDIDDRALMMVIKRRVKEVPSLVEKYLRSARRNPVRITLDVPLSVVAAWSLTPLMSQDG